MAGRYIAFFDVDQTLTQVVSMISFLDHLAPERLAAFRDLKKTWVQASRELINTRYYEVYAGLRHTEVMAAGRDWYTSTRARLGDKFFIPAALAQLRHHQSHGATIALVSGSFPACLSPLAEELGGCVLLCSQQEVDLDGVYTGRLLPPQTIGLGKAVAARQLAQELQVDLADCHAYGDHISDLPLLKLVGHAHVVGEDVAMTPHIQENGWRVHSATAATR